MVMEIQLTRGQRAIVDDFNFERVSALKWYCYPKKTGKFYAARHETYNGKRVTVQMHDFVFGERDRSLEIDHLDGNSLNNTLSNLRLCTRSENNRNRGPQKNNLSGYKGVTTVKRKKGDKFKAKIEFNGEKISLGYYPTPELAARAYDRKARELFGEFARCNFPED